MYESFYNLHPTPFRLTPDPFFFFESETHKRGLSYLRFGFYQREGFVAITGAPGTGKTELTLNLIEELPHQKTTFAKIVTTNLDADQLLDLIATSLQIDIDHMSKGSVLKKLENFFISQARTGKQVLLIIDEAHNLSVKSLLELSMLENFQLDGKPVMQCFLVGQLSLEEKLNLPELEPLKQRVITSTRLENLDQQETREYVIHRLSKSGWNNNPIIHDKAFFFIHHFTNGVPRKINSLCNRLLLNSYVENRHEIDANTVNKVFQEIQEEAVGKSLDLDFADMQTIMETSLDSQHDDDEQPVISKENKTQQPALPRKNKVQPPAMSHKNNNPEKHNDPDNEFFIPEFVKKTQGQNPSSLLRVLKDIPAPEGNELQWENTASITKTQYQSKQEFNISQNDAHVATTKHVARQTANRRSGLLDKDLIFLSSLVESSTPTTPYNELKPKPKPTPKIISPPTVEEKPEQETATIHKVIIDESFHNEDKLIGSNARKVIVDDSVYEHDEHNELVDSNIEKDWRKPRATIPIFDDWRHTTLAAIVVGSLIISISWLYDSDSDPASIVAENQTEINSNNENLAEHEVFSSGAPVDIELPVISSSNTNAETIPEAGSETSSVVTSMLSASDTTTLVADSSDSVNNSESGELDSQLTQILEKTGTEYTEPANAADNGPIATTGSDNHKTDFPSKLAALSTDKNSANSKPDESMPDKRAIKSQTSETQTIKSNTSPVIGSTASTSEVIESKTVALQKNELGSALVALPLKDPTTSTSLDVTASTQQSYTTGTSISMHNASRDSVTHQPEPAISPTDLKTLLSKLSAAYETGNLQQLVSTFALNIESREGLNRAQMLKEYQRLFTITDRRRLAIQDIKWSTKDRQMLGEGNFEVSIREKGATKPTRYQGKISFAVARELDTVVIKKLDYDYGQ